MLFILLTRCVQLRSPVQEHWNFVVVVKRPTPTDKKHSYQTFVTDIPHGVNSSDFNKISGKGMVYFPPDSGVVGRMSSFYRKRKILGGLLCICACKKK